MADDLNEKQKRFCEEYVIDHNGKVAAIRSGYSYDTAAQIASRLLTKAKVQEYIQVLKKAQVKRLERTADDVLEGMWKIAEDCENPASARVSAYSKIGEHLGMFGSKGSVTVYAGADAKFDPARTIIDPPKRDEQGNLVQ